MLETRNQKKKESPTYDKRGNKGNKPTDTSDPKNHPDCRDDHRTSYEQRSQLLSSYIISRKENIFYSRNIKLALVAQDPLGEAFKVKAFHRCQDNNLIRSQLIPVTSSGQMENRKENHYGSPGIRNTTKDKGSQYKASNEINKYNGPINHQKPKIQQNTESSKR